MKLHSVVSYSIVFVCHSQASPKGWWSCLNYHRGRYCPCHTINFLTIRTLAHGSMLSILSSEGKGSILSIALVCELAWSYAIPRQGGSANPSCTTKRAH